MKLLDYKPGELQVKLSRYLEDDDKFKATFDYTKQRFEAAEQLQGHNWDHTYRDVLNAIVIGEAENAEMSVVLPAITMHDIGFLYGATSKTHGVVGADKLPEYLQEGGINYSEEIIQKMADCIRTHKGSAHDEKPQSLEAKVVADADLLDKFGPFGVYQSLRVQTEFKNAFEKATLRGIEILKLKLETETGRRLAESGRQFVIDFFEELLEAYEPYKEM